MSVQHGDLSFERLGHASVRIETGDGLVVYIDPWSDVIDGERGDGDLVLVTHDDFDHYDPDGIDAVASDDATVVVYEGIDTSDLDRNENLLAYDESITARGVDVQALPAHNRADGDHVDEDGEPFHAEHEVVGLLLGFDGTTVYFTSDTDFLPAHNHVEADVFVPAIGGHYTMDRHEAAEFAASVDADLVLPVHYDTFEAIETDAEAFADDVEDEDTDVELF